MKTFNVSIGGANFVCCAESAEDISKAVPGVESISDAETAHVESCFPITLAELTGEKPETIPVIERVKTAKAKTAKKKSRK